MELETEGDISIDTIPDENIEINMIEFKLEDKQPDISANLFIFSTGNTSRDSSDIKVSNHKRVSSNITNYEINNISGELLKYKPSSVDMYIPRWCVLTDCYFTYYKSHYSCLFEDTPLLSISKDSIISIYAYKQSKDPKFLLEINTIDSPLIDLNISKSRRSSSISDTGHLMHKPRHLIPRSQKFTQTGLKTKLIPINRQKNSEIRHTKKSWTNREIAMYMSENRLLFGLSSEIEWNKWQNAFKILTSAQIIFI